MRKEGLAIAALLCVTQPLLTEPAGEYEVTGLRRSSEVQSTPAVETDLLGRTVVFGPELQWIDGSNCSEWSVEESSGIGPSLEDPNLSDVIIETLAPPDASEQIDFPRYLLRCDSTGQPLGSLIEVDSHVLVTSTPSGAINVILQKPYPATVIRRLQIALEELGLYAGEADGVLDGRTRDAIARFAESSGAAYRFRDPAISENLLVRLGIPALEN